MRKIAHEQGYIKEEVEAGLEHYERATRRIHPPDSFDKAGRFTPAETSQGVSEVRPPSRRSPYSAMKAARTARHCAEVFGVSELAVKRVARAIKSCAAFSALERKRYGRTVRVRTDAFSGLGSGGVIGGERRGRRRAGR